jgi:signal transduction histidine kinase
LQIADCKLAFDFCLSICNLQSAICNPMINPRLWRYIRGLAAPVALWVLFAAVLVRPLQSWLRGDADYDRAALTEWIEETRVARDTLPEMVRDYLNDLDQARRANPAASPANDLLLRKQANEIEEHLKAMGVPPTKLYPGQLPLFPIVYSLEVQFVGDPETPAIVWDSKLPRHAGLARELKHEIYELEPPRRLRAVVLVRYQLHAYNKQHQAEQVSYQRLRWVTVLALAGTLLGSLWLFLMQRREQDRERQKALAQKQIDQAERLLLQEELRRREAEQLREDAQRQLLEQQLEASHQESRAAAAERQALELKSQLYASIGIMAGSYAHNIKNLLVRPNDLLARLLESQDFSGEQQHMLHEVRQTLGTVTERLQQILRTVRRDPNHSELARLDLNAVVRDLYATWVDLAREKWKLTLSVELSAEPLWIEADLSHVQQAVENLLFNARDATFEMRNHQRDQAHRASLNAQERRQALIAAAAWKGSVVLRTCRKEGRAVLEVQDNGIGMTEEVRRRCTETHFSTKRDNALYEGASTGMGLGLSFVVVILEHHRATLEIESEPLHGTTFRVGLPLASPD